MSHGGPPLLAYLSLAASMALVGSYVGLSKLLVAVFPVLLLAWLRFGIAAVAMVHWVRRRPGEAPLSRADRRLLFWESFLGNFLFSICMLYGVQATSALAAGVVMAAIPAAVAILSRLFLRERIAPRVQAAIACAAAGIALLALVAAPEAAGTEQAPWWGYALLLGAVVCEASYVVIGKRLTGSALAAPDQRAHQPVGAGAGDAFRRSGRPCTSTSRPCRGRPGRCWSSMPSQPAWSRSGCGCRACGMCPRRGRGCSP